MKSCTVIVVTAVNLAKHALSHTIAAYYKSAKNTSFTEGVTYIWGHIHSGPICRSIQHVLGVAEVLQAGAKYGVPIQELGTMKDIATTILPLQALKSNLALKCVCEQLELVACKCIAA